MPKTVVPKGHVNGLARCLANDESCRTRLLETGTLLKWPSPKMTGVINMKALRMNADLMLAVGSVLGPQSSSVLGLLVKPLKQEAWGSSMYSGLLNSIP